MKVYIGIDWSKNKHDLTFLNQTGRVIARKVIRHTEQGFWELEHTRRALGVSPQECAIGIETADSLLVEFLWQHHYPHLFVIPPHMTKSSRGRQRHSQARSDQSDADLLADLVRTDRHRLIHWRPNQPLTREIVRVNNRLQEKLLRYYPAALHVFSKLAQPITLAFIQAYPDPAQARALSFEQFRRFAVGQGYPNPVKLGGCYLALQQAFLSVAEDILQIYQQEAIFLSQTLQQLLHAKHAGIQHLQALFQQHPDQAVFASLPGAGDLLAPSLLVQFGDDRERFPLPESVQRLAGTCPVTIQSGKRQQVRFRYACNREFRRTAVQFAKLSIRQSAWADAYFSQSLLRTKSISQAYRCLANRWLAIIWKCWQTNQPYDEAYHLSRCVQRRLAK